MSPRPAWRTLISKIPVSAEVRRYFLLMGAASALAFVRSLVVAKALGPTGLGYYALINLITNVATNVCAGGLFIGLTRELTLLRSQAREEEASDLRNRVTSWLIVIFVMATALYSGAVTAVVPSNDALFGALLVVGPYAFGTLLFNTAMIELSSRNMMVAFAVMLGVRNAVTTVTAAAISAAGLGVEAVALGEVAVNTLIFIGLLAWSGGFRLQLRGADDRVRETARVGLPFTVGQLLRTVSTNSDRWFVANFFPISAFGVYSLSTLLRLGGDAATAAIGLYIQPRFIHEFAQSSSVRALLARALRFARLVAVAGALGGVPLVLGLNWAVGQFLDDYAAARPLVPFIVVGVLLDVLIVFLDAVIFAAGRGGVQTAMYGIGLLFLALGCAALEILDADLVWVAVLYAVGRLATLVGNYLVCRRLRAQLDIDPTAPLPAQDVKQTPGG